MSRFMPLHPFLSAELLGKHISHAYIFSGRDALDQALSMSAALNCRSLEADNAACGSCAACRSILSGSYPDLQLLAPQDTGHKAEAMRALVARAGLSHLEGAYRVFILQDAEKISPEAANTLLKLLEEPIAGTVLILITQQPERLLPTILSRCQLFCFDNNAAAEPPLTEEQLAAAEQFLLSLGSLPIYQVLLLAREYDKDREGQQTFLFALLKVLHQAARGEKRLPMAPANVLRSAALVERALELMSKTVNQKLLTDVVYLRLKQNSAG